MRRRRTGTWAFWIIGNLIAYAVVLDQARFSAVSLVLFVNGVASIALDPRSGDSPFSWRAALRSIAIIVAVSLGAFLFVRSPLFGQLEGKLWFILSAAALLTATTAYRILWRRKAIIAESRVSFGGREFSPR